MNPTPSKSAVLILCPLTFGAGGADAPPTPPAPAQQLPATPPVPEAKVFVTKHKMTLGSAPLAYTTTAGTMRITNEKDEPIALFGYTAHIRDGGDRAARPLMFAYNGGPGSASAWLHMGILGPRRTQLAGLEASMVKFKKDLAAFVDATSH